MRLSVPFWNSFMEIACGSLSGTASLDRYPGRGEAHEFWLLSESKFNGKIEILIIQKWIQPPLMPLTDGYWTLGGNITDKSPVIRQSGPQMERGKQGRCGWKA